MSELEISGIAAFGIEFINDPENIEIYTERETPDQKSKSENKPAEVSNGNKT
jgi:hypothetical protein